MFTWRNVIVDSVPEVLASPADLVCASLAAAAVLLVAVPAIEPD
jgi:hypothetical protein